MKSMFLTGKSELVLVICVVAILMLLFTPINSVMLDFLLLTNFCLALTILMLTFYTDKPLSFSTFPSLILIATLFRIGLNVSSTRLILSDADAGEVIGSIGSYVVGGNYVIGLVVFLILIVVQYVVVTNGAQRVAEVAARFTLDSMPGKQMSIDADLNMGIIDEHEAKARRLAIEKEASFYGAMDGSTKFVKGDAIAGIIIIIINIVGGLSIGVAQHGMPWSEAVETFTLLTVGDGIVTQIPSLIVATATGIIITRAASDAQLGKELSRQITSQPKILVLVSVTMLGVMLMPGMPWIPVLSLAIGFVLVAFLVRHGPSEVEDTNFNTGDINDSAELEKNGKFDDLYALSQFEIIELRMGAELHNTMLGEEATLVDRIQSFRRQFSLDFGLVIPKEATVEDSLLAGSEYEILLHGARVASGIVESDKFLAIDPSGKLEGLDGKKAKEPTYGLPALWVDDDVAMVARKNGYTVVDPETTLLTHFTETIKSHSSELLTRSETENLVSRLPPRNLSLVNELIPAILTYSEIQRVLQSLLQEKISIRNLTVILESLVEFSEEGKNPLVLVEKVRSRLKNQICQSLMDKQDSLPVLTLDAELEREVISGITNDELDQGLMLAPALTESLLKSLSSNVEEMLRDRVKPVLLCSPQIRRQLHNLCERALPQLNVISLNEIPSNININSYGTVKYDK